jgi:lactoylglutathione lyase
VQIAIGTDDVYKSAEAVELVTKELGGKILRQPGPLPGLNTKITSFLDPDGWKVVCLLTILCITLLYFNLGDY